MAHAGAFPSATAAITGVTGRRHDIPGREPRAIETAQAAGYVDARWEPMELLSMLFGIGMAWARWPRQDDIADDTAVVTARCSAAIETAARIVTPRDGASSTTR